MRTLNEAVDQFSYHPATPDTAPKHALVRDNFAALVIKLWPMIPDGPEKTLMLRNMQQAAMYANLAIALTAPVDHEFADVARVLPE